MKRAVLSVLLLMGGCLDRRSSHQEAPVPNPPSGGQEGGTDAEESVGGDDDYVADAHDETGSRCVPMNDGVEICNGLDDDCDGVVDDVSAEHPQLMVDPLNCGACGNRCQGANADPYCRYGECWFVCAAGWSDIDGLAENGCEIRCVITQGGTEECDGYSGDCRSAFSEPGDADEVFNSLGFRPVRSVLP